MGIVHSWWETKNDTLNTSCISKINDFTLEQLKNDVFKIVMAKLEGANIRKDPKYIDTLYIMNDDMLNNEDVETYANQTIIPNPIDYEYFLYRVRQLQEST